MNINIIETIKDKEVGDLSIALGLDKTAFDAKLDKMRDEFVKPLIIEIGGIIAGLELSKIKIAMYLQENFTDNEILMFASNSMESLITGMAKSILAEKNGNDIRDYKSALFPR